ncbi:MAG: SDR family oxidoreductase [Deltaproteobacteria bacterium]|nr:SDR family oxidoreductase [Deltaproteobacteria bacterium]
MMKLKGKVAVITGGNSGIGLATAKDFKAQGARVVIFGRSQRALDVANQTIGNGTLAVQGDVTQLPDLDRLYQQTVERFGKVDILMVNAGIAKPTPIEQVDEAVFDETSNTNFKGAFFTVQRALSHLNDGASIILVTGYNNQKGIPGYSVNSATKAALRSLARTFSAELLHRRIRVNALSPGNIETPIFDKLGLPVEPQKWAEGIPMKRIGRAEEMAKAALFLASDDSSYMAGAELVIDGGKAQI